MKKKIKVQIEYDCQLGYLCPICIEEALIRMERESCTKKEYRLKNIVVKEI